MALGRGPGRPGLPRECASGPAPAAAARRPGTRPGAEGAGMTRPAGTAAVAREPAGPGRDAELVAGEVRAVLAGPDAAWINGQVLRANGGLV